MIKEPVFSSGDSVRIWQKFCGFLKISLPDFMKIQRELLMEQIDMVADSPLGKKIINGKKPASIEEFRRKVPLTKYEEYRPFLDNQQTDSLAFKPVAWSHTSGRGGEFKWVPYSQGALDRFADAAMAGLILAAAKREGEVKLKGGSKFFSIAAPRPYLSGISSWLYNERFGLELIPPQDIAEKLDFQERIELGFQIALRSGVDVIGAMASTLVKMGQRITEGSGKMNMSSFLLRPSVMIHLLGAAIKAKMQKRQILPKDLWRVSGLLCGGTDTTVLRKQLEYYWGVNPHEAYGCTEAGIIAIQSWKRQGMTFNPFSSYYEFISEKDWMKTQKNPDYQPQTVLMDELEEGRIYELVTTSFYGMPFLRYRPGDLLKVISLEEADTGIKLPQISFYSRADGLIDLHSIVRLDEKTIWQAIENTGVKYEDWSARKEYENDWPIVKIYTELKQSMDADTLQNAIHEQLMANPLYAETIGEVEMMPVRVRLLTPKSFQRYYEAKQREGADLAHLKPPRMNAQDPVIQNLTSFGE